MTAALELLNALRVKDVSLWVDNDQISYDAPAGALTEGDLAALRSHKPEILKLLAARDPGAAPIERADRSAPLPLSLAQQRLWFIDRLEGAAAAYNLQGAFRLAGDLDVAALLAALEAIVRRHEALRTALPSSDGVAVQSIAERLEWTLGTADISVLPVAQRHAAVQAHAASEAHARFNLSRTPLWRALLVRVGPAEHVLLVTMHHIIADGWSLGILAQELAAHYASHRRGGPAPFAPLAVQYPDYAQWQRRCLAGGALQEQRDYWRRQLSGTPALLDLPTDHPRPAVQSYAGASVPLTLSPELAAELKSLGRSHGATLFMTLLAGWSILLSRLSREEDVVVGVPMANRPRTELEPLIGLFVNTLALRTRLDAAASVTEVLRRVREATLAAHANQDLPFAEVIEALRPERSLSHSPLFQTLFALQNAPQQDIVIADGGREGGLVLRPTGEYIAGGIDTARFDLTLSLEESGGTLTGALNYASDLFDRATIDRWIDHFKTLLTAMVQTPSSSVSALPLLAARERQVVVEQFNDTFADYGGPALVHRLFEAQAAATPLAPAVELAGRHLSYAELNGRANQLARHLLTRGIGPDRVVGVCIERSFEMVVALLGILKAGGAYVPLDPAYPRERLAFMLADAGMPVLLTQQHLAGELPVGEAEVFALDARWPELAGYDGSDLAGATQTSRSLAYVIYTSGSTGKPKGAMNEHRAVANRLQWMQHSYRLGPADAVLQKTPLSFDVSVWEVFWPLLTGARLVLARPGGHHDPHYLGQVIREARVTTLHFVPSMLQAFVDAPASAACTKVRHIVSSGEELSVALQEQCLAVLPQAALHNLYGPTEAAVDVSSWDCQSGSSLVRVPIGRPIANTRLYLLDGARQPVPVGVPGEIYIGGIAVGRGYWNRPELTAERFVADPFSGDPEARLYKTGDLGRWRSDGAIEYLGRNDHQVKVRGFRIELGEIEAVLRRAPAVHEVAVIVREDGAAAQQLVAYFTCRDEEPSPEALRTFAAQELPTYMVPSAFVKLGVLPLQPNGKLDRSALPRPDFAQAMESRYVAPRNAVEEALCAIWAAVLGLPKLGIDDNFFGVGGDSILSLRAVEKARAAGLPTTVEDLFRDPTVARLAQVVLERHTTVAASVPVEPFALLLPEERAAFVDDPGIEDAYPLSALQAGMYFHSELHRDSGVYHDIFSLSIGGSFAVALFEQALSALVARHPMLRSSFHTSVADRLVQAVHRAVPLPLAVHDISHLDQAVQEQFVERWMEEEKWRRFPWTQPPLFRVVVHRRAPERFQFTLSFHHAILDGWSLASLQTELFEHYLALHSGRELTIAAPQSLYRDYIALEEQALQSAEAREFWTRLLADAVRLKLPEPEKARARQKGIQVATCDSELDEGLCGRLKARSRELKVPLKTLLFAAHLKVMALASGHSDVLTGLVSNGRLEEADGDRALGLYLNSLPFRLQLEDGSWRGLVSAVHRLEQAALPYRRYPMQAVQQLLGGEPLINTLFNYVHFHVYQRLFEVGMVKVPDSRTFEQTSLDLVAVFSRALTGEGLSLSLAYDPAALDEEQAARLSVYYHRALAAIAQDVDARHGRATLLTDDELALQRQWNDTVAVWDGPRLVHELIETQAAKTPSGVAVVCDDRSISYEELNRRANQLARYLRAHGASFDRVVAICVDRTIEMVIGILGVLKSGAAYLPVDPQYPRERLAYMLENAAPPIMLTDGSLCDKLPRTSATLVMLDADWPEIARHDAANVEDATASPADLAYVIYTSGSTGQPKGTAMPHRVLVNLIEWQRRSWPVQHAQRTLQFAALGFDVAFQEMFSTLAVGGTLVLIPDAARSDPAALIAALRKNEVQRFFVPFSALQAMAEVATRTGAMPLALEDLITAGERLRITPEIARFFGSHRGCRLHNHYGPTECHAATAKTLTGDPDTWDEFPTIGRPIANARIYLLDTKRRPVPVGTPGEIYIGGVTVARGYLNRPELTAERFVRDPFSDDPQARMYKTGDVARFRNSGEIDFLGRNDDQVKIRGFRVELGEVEWQLRRHPAVKEALVVAREVAAGDKRLVAYVTRSGDDSPEELRSWLKPTLPDYMLPSAYVTLESLPLTPNGKVDRRNLPAPELDAFALQDFEAPEGEIETSLAAMWQSLLGVERVGRKDNFFDLGGHSLLALQVTYRIYALLGWDVEVSTLFDHPTLAGLAQQLETGGAATRAPLEIADRSQTLALSAAQRRLWWLATRAPGKAVYQVPQAVRLRGALDVPAFGRALDSLVERHEALRTTYVDHGSGPVLQIAPEGRFLLRVRDVSSLPEGEREAAIEAEVAAEAATPFDLSVGPMIRGRLLRSSDDEHVFLFTAHSIVYDGWSRGVLLRELGALYLAYRDGAPSPLAPLPIQYADYAQWQNEWLHKVLDAGLDFWLQRLAGAPELLELPTDRPRPAEQSYAGNGTRFVLDRELTSGLRSLAARHDATLFMTLFAGWAILMSKLSRQPDVVIGALVANREVKDVDSLIGSFVNYMPLRVQLYSNPSVSELLYDVKQMAKEAYANQWVPFIDLAETAQPMHHPSFHPVFQVSMMLENTPPSPLLLPGIGFAPQEIPFTSAELDLSLSLKERGGEVDGLLIYATDLFDGTTIDSWIASFQSVLQQMVRDAATRIEAIEVADA